MKVYVILEQKFTNMTSVKDIVSEESLDKYLTEFNKSYGTKLSRTRRSSIVDDYMGAYIVIEEKEVQ